MDILAYNLAEAIVDRLEGKEPTSKNLQEAIKTTLQETILNTSVTRVEVIDQQGRAYTNRDNQLVQISLQDELKTLKIFIY